MESSDLVAFIASGCGAFSDVFVIMHLYFRAVRGARVTYRGYSFGRLGNGQVGEEFSGLFDRVWRDFRSVSRTYASASPVCPAGTQRGPKIEACPLHVLRASSHSESQN